MLNNVLRLIKIKKILPGNPAGFFVFWKIKLTV